MKIKNKLALIKNALIELAAIAFMLIGIIMLVASFFTPVSITNASILIALGLILSVAMATIFKLDATINALVEYLEALKSIKFPYSSADNSNLSPAEGIQKIIITPETTQEEIDEITKRFPGLKDTLENLMGNEDIEAMSGELSTADYNLNSYSIEELQTELQIAVNKNEFERAAEIRDEINSRQKM